MSRYLITFISALVMTVVLHGPVAMQRYGVPFGLRSDAHYYLDGAHSIYEFDVEKKFNKDRYPVVAQKRRIVKDDFPEYAPYVLALYPNPSFKFGYSLFIAFVSAPFSDQFTSQAFSRIVITNFVLSVLTCWLIMLTFLLFTNSYLWSIAAGVAFLSETFLTYNNYYYGSHTLSGIFLSVLAAFFYIKHNGNGRLFAFAFCLSASVLSSSHHVMIAVLLGMCFGVRELSYGSLRLRLKKVSCLAGGAALPLIYILLVERYFHFKELGIPRYFDQLKNYRSTVSNLIGTYPLGQRFLWDLRLENVFFPVILAAALGVIGLILYFRLRLPDLRAKVLYAVLIFAWLLNAGFTQPISRAAAPFIVGFYLALVGLLWKISTIKRNLAVSIVCACVSIQVLNFAIYFNLVPNSFGSSKETFHIDEWPIVLKQTDDFFTSLKLSSQRFEFMSLGVQEFLDRIKSEGDFKYVSFEGISLARYYAPMRRFIPQFMPREEMTLTSENLRTDFRLVREIFELQRSGKLKSDSIQIIGRALWPLEYWDHEYNYIYGYHGLIHKFTAGTGLENIDTRAIYYVRISDLMQAMQ